jgi:DNA end-binding protein Ku
MAARSTWKGYLKLNLVSVPVKAYTANASGSGEVRLNQLHKQCNSRIQYKKTCPIHGEVSGDEIVSGYEYSKGQYVIVDTEELDKLRTEDEKAITINTFVSPDAIDPIYFSGKSYYLVPDGPVGQKAYSVVLQAMVDEKRYGVANVVFHGREQLVLVRPLGGLLTLEVLSYENQVTKPSAFHEEAPKTEIAPEELKLAKTLISASTAKKFDLGAYKDLYTEKLTQLVEAKIAGKEIVAPPAHEGPQVINLMEALKQSVAQVAPTKKEAAGAKPPRKMAPSIRKPERGVRRQKSG